MRPTDIGWRCDQICRLPTWTALHERILPVASAITKSGVAYLELIADHLRAVRLLLYRSASGIIRRRELSRDMIRTGGCPLTG